MHVISLRCYPLQVEVRALSKQGSRGKLCRVSSPERPCLYSRKKPRHPPALTGCCLPLPRKLLRGHEGTPRYSRTAFPLPRYPRRSSHHLSALQARDAGPSPQPSSTSTLAASWLGGHLPRPRLHRGPSQRAGRRGGTSPWSSGGDYFRTTFTF